MGLKLNRLVQAILAGGIAPAGPVEIFRYDPSGGVFKSNGTVYASEALMNTALGATKVGEVTSYPTYVDPAFPELVTNGTFTGGDISGWTAGQFSGSGASIAAGTGGNADRLVVNTGGATQAFARQTKSLGQGRAYRMRASVQRDTLTGQPSLGAGYQTNFQNRAGFKQFTPAQFTQQVGELVTTSTQTATTPTPDNVEPTLFPASTSFGMGSNANTESGGIYVFDDVSIKECVVLPGALSGRLASILTFTTPASFTKTETVLQFGIDGNSTTANSEVSRIRLSISATGDLTYSAQVKSIVAASQLLGTLSPSTSYSVWMHNGPDSFGVRLGSGGTLYKYGASSNFASSILGKAALEFIPGLGLMWRGRSAISAANDSFTGVFTKHVLYSANAFPVSNTNVSIGDSLAGSGAASTDGTSLGTYYGTSGPWSSGLARALVRPHKAIVFSWGGKYGSDVRGAFGVVLAADGLRTPAQFPSLLDGLAPYANDDPRIIIDMSYNLMNASGSLSDANAKATSNYNTVMGQINDIVAVYPQITKFMVIGCRAGSFDANWLNGGYKKAGMNTLNALYAAGQSSGANAPYIFHDLHADLIDPSKGLVWGGVTTPTAQDISDYGNGIIPESLRTDAIHPSGPSFGSGVTPYAGVKAEVESKRRAFVAAGWDTFSTAGTVYSLAA